MTHPRNPSNEQKKKLDDTLRSIWVYLVAIKSPKRTPEEKQKYREKLQTAYSEVNRHLIDEKLEVKMSGQEPRKALGILNEATRELAVYNQAKKGVVEIKDTKKDTKGTGTMREDKVEVIYGSEVRTETKNPLQPGSAASSRPEPKDNSRVIQESKAGSRPVEVGRRLVEDTSGDEELARYLQSQENIKGKQGTQADIKIIKDWDDKKRSTNEKQKHYKDVTEVDMREHKEKRGFEKKQDWVDVEEYKSKSPRR